MLTQVVLKNSLAAQEPLYGVVQEETGESEVKRIVPTLQPVAMILTGETGSYRGRPDAVVYPMPGGELVRLRLMDNNDYDYDNARLLPESHPIVRAYIANPNQEIKAIASPEDIQGALLSKNDVAWLQSTLEAQHKRDLKKAQDLGLIP